jgi:hypothetical protein
MSVMKLVVMRSIMRAVVCTLTLAAVLVEMMAGSTPLGANQTVHKINTVQISSFAGDPQIIEPRLLTTPTRWQLAFEASFANGCLANRGLRVTFADPSPLSIHSGSRQRVVVVEGAEGEAGCPDFFAPVTRPYSAELPPESSIRRVVFLDAVQIGRNEKTAQFHQPYSIDLPQYSTTQPTPNLATRIVAEPLFPKARLPLLANIALTGQLVSAAHYRYDLSFDIVRQGRCAEGGNLHSKIIESRTAIGAKTATRVIDWLFVVQQETPDCSEATGSATARRFTVNSDVGTSSPRAIAIVNGIYDRHSQNEGPFTILDLLDK